MVYSNNQYGKSKDSCNPSTIKKESGDLIPSSLNSLKKLSPNDLYHYVMGLNTLIEKINAQEFILNNCAVYIPIHDKGGFKECQKI